MGGRRDVQSRGSMRSIFEEMGDYERVQAAAARQARLAALAALPGAEAAVFRLQTSEVRTQLLGHLGTAAAKAAKEAGKEKAASVASVFGGSTRREECIRMRSCGAS